MRRENVNRAMLVLGSGWWNTRTIDADHVNTADSRFSRQAEFIAVLCLLAVSWLVVPYRWPDAVRDWINNEAFPQLWFWVCVFAFGSIVMRRALIGEGAEVKKPIWILTTATMLLVPWVWRWDSPHMVYYVHLVWSAVLIYGFGGIGWLRLILPALLFFCFLTGLPLFACEGILQGISTKFTLVFCQTFLSADYIGHGHWVYLPLVGHAGDPGLLSSVEVTAECSGGRSLLGMVLLAMLFCADLRLRMRRKLFLFGLAVSVGIAGNMVRLGISVVLNHHGMEHLASGLPHSFLGQLLVGVEAVIVYLLWRRLLQERQKCPLPTGRSDEGAVT